MTYLIGSLRNPEIPAIAAQLREGLNDEVFASWWCASDDADDTWERYEKGRGLTYKQALQDYAAQNVLRFDKTHLLRCDRAVLVAPFGKSGCIELGFVLGREKGAYVVLNGEPEGRWDVMLGLATGVFYSVEELITAISLTEEIRSCREQMVALKNRTIPVKWFDADGPSI